MSVSTAFVFFEVRNDKNRGNLVLTIRSAEKLEDVHFFRYHHQTLDQHPEQMQNIVQRAGPTIRTKSIKVDIFPFLIQYWNLTGKFFEFKGVKLNSSEQQVSMVYERRIKKEVGIIKRKKTILNSKEQKLAKKNQQMLAKLQSDEQKFQVERAERIRVARADMEE